MTVKMRVTEATGEKLLRYLPPVAAWAPFCPSSAGTWGCPWLWWHGTDGGEEEHGTGDGAGMMEREMSLRVHQTRVHVCSSPLHPWFHLSLF